MQKDRDCYRPDECRIQTGTVSSTCVGYPPIYDGHGRNLNPDGNITFYDEECFTCKRRWSVSSQYGTEKREEI